jgi:plastocyanin
VGKRGWLILALGLGALGVGAYVASGGPHGGAAPNALETTEYAEIGGLDDFFQPEVLRVEIGTTVEWYNRGRNPHNIVAEDGSFTSPILERGDEFEHTYDAPGLFPFFCSLHGSAGVGMSGIIAVGDVPLTADGDGGVGPGREPVPTEPGTTIRVPADQPTIQAGVDAAEPGDLVLVAPGVYHESVLVLTPYLTIRGEDRNTTILDGELTRTNGIHVAEADGVVLENLTAAHYQLNGFYWTGVQGYRGSYLTAYANGDYGIYAYASQYGRFEHSYASGSPDSGFYIGECQPCHAVISDVIAEGNALGYSGTNAGGDLWIINSEWAHNGAGIVPNTLDSEGLAPQRGATIAGNSVHDHGLDVVPTKRLQTPAFGTGILIGGGRENVVEGNVVLDSTVYGIAVLPNLDDNLWLTRDNVVRDNHVANSGQADLALGGPAIAGDCFAGNEHVDSLPPAVEILAGCDAVAGVGGDLAPTVSLLAHFVAALGGHYDPGDWEHAVAPDEQPQLPDAATAPVVLAVPEIAVPGPHAVRSVEETLAVTSSSESVRKEMLLMGVPLGPIGSTLLGLYLYVLPLALYAAWIAIAVWDLIRREVPDGRRIGWMALVLAVPIVGPIAYFTLGGSAIPRAVRLFLVFGGIAIYIGVAALVVLVQVL